jgi:phage terminase large subunit-like protein
VKFSPATGDKETRAKPVSAQCESGNVKMIRGLWNDDFVRVLENFPIGLHDDEVDPLSGAHGILSAMTGGGFSKVEIKAERAQLDSMGVVRLGDYARRGRALV